MQRHDHRSGRGSGRPLLIYLIVASIAVVCLLVGVFT
jgi:hypothetical protein